MINDRDSKTEFINDNKYSIEFPYKIGTILEMYANPNTLAEIREYRVTNENILVGLSSKIFDRNLSPEFEITIDELISNWKKTNKITFKGNIGTRLDLGEEFDRYARKLTLFK